MQKLQEPSHLERLLERLVTQAALVPPHAYPLRRPGALPWGFRRALMPDGMQRAWACWTDSFHIWLFTAKLSLALSRERGTPALTVNEYGEQGALKEVCHWMVDGQGCWQRCTD